MNNEAIKLREKLAELAHDQWSGWIKYMFGKCDQLDKDSEALLIPEWAVLRWQRQAKTPYNELSDKEKDSDRTEADKFLDLLKAKPTCDTCGDSGRAKPKDKILASIYPNGKIRCPDCPPKACEKCEHVMNCTHKWSKTSGYCFEMKQDKPKTELKHDEDCTWNLEQGGSPCDCSFRLKLKKQKMLKEPKIFRCKHFQEGSHLVPMPFGSGNCSEPLGNCAIESESEDCTVDCSDYTEEPKPPPKVYAPDEECAEAAKEEFGIEAIKIKPKPGVGELVGDMKCPECYRGVSSKPGTASYSCRVPGCIKIRFCCAACICQHMARHVEERDDHISQLEAECKDTLKEYNDLAHELLKWELICRKE